MNKNLRGAGFVSLTLGALGCGEPFQADPLNPQSLFKNDTTSSDSGKTDAWRKFLDAKELHRAWAPAPDSPWRPFYKPTLVASIAAVQSAAMPVRNSLMPPAEEEAARFAAGEISDAAIFVDLLGEESIVWAATLRKKGLVPVLTINNWPHQFGVIALERPLGALLYYADEVSKATHSADARPVFILERSRLGQKGLNPQSHQFDNRYYHAHTDFPGAVLLASKGIKRIIYVNPRGVTQGCEEDDLSDYFTELWNAGIQFTYVKPGSVTNELAVVTPAPRETIFSRPAVQTYTSTPSSSHYHHHYYRPYRHYHDWHYSYWRRSGGAWGGYGSSGYDSGYSSATPTTGTSSTSRPTTSGTGTGSTSRPSTTGTGSSSSGKSSYSGGSSSSGRSSGFSS
jgi:hypothetical protein